MVKVVRSELGLPEGGEDRAGEDRVRTCPGLVRTGLVRTR
jgi:hypothetical protein